MQIENMKLEELEELEERIKKQIAFLKRDKKNEYEFDFEASNDPRKGVPYVARMVLGKNGALDREFFDLAREWGKGGVTISGTYKAKEGDIIEQRIGGSWKNDYRYFYLVKDGKLEEFGDARNSQDKFEVKKYLNNKIGGIKE